MTAPSPDSIKESVEKSEKWVDWLVEVLRSKNPVRKLLLLDVLFFLIFNPFSFPTLLHGVTGKDTPVWYSWIFWPIIGLLSLTAVITAYRIKQRESKAINIKWDEPDAIKGLLPFGFADAELFSRLQREDDLRQYLPMLINPQFRFGILCGESGCGKTSFLQAGLWPRLMRQGHRCLYIKLTDLDPLDSIRLALLEQFKLPKEAVNGGDLLALMGTALEEDSQPIILLFDQFEQFFIHHKQAKHRKVFVQALSDWYRRQPPLPVRMLICIRKDFYGDLTELHNAMGYSLGPQDNKLLEKFMPEQAAKIFQVIAETEHISLDESFITEFTQQELASGDDKLISPVDIQILAWMIAGQRSRDERAFNRESFQRLGGIEGLLESFLSRALAARETESRRKAALQVLRTLADLDGDARAGALTMEALREKLAGVINDAEVVEALEWLTRANVRLVNLIDNRYELAHERLIPALRRLEPHDTDQASQLLDSRVNEWLIHHQSSSYLLTWSEWRLIEKQRFNLDWGRKRLYKKSFLLRTRRYWHTRVTYISSALLLIVLGIIGYIGYIGWQNSEMGQASQIRNNLLRLSKRIDDPTLSQIVERVASADMPQPAFQIANEIKNPITRAGAISSIAGAIAKIAVTKQSDDLFKQAIQTAEGIGDPYSRANAFGAIAKAMGQVDVKRSADLFKRAIEAARGIDDQHIKANALRAIIELNAKTVVTKQPDDVFEQAIQIAEGIDDPYSRANAFSAIAKAMGQVDVKRSADLFKRAIEAAGRISSIDDRYIDEQYIKANAFGSIAGAIAHIDTPQSIVLFEEALKTIRRINDPYSRASALSTVTKAIRQIDVKQSANLFKQAIELAEDIKENKEKASALSATAEAIAPINIKQSIGLLKQAIEAVESLDDLSSKDSRFERDNISDNPRYKPSSWTIVAGPLNEVAKIAIAKESSDSLKPVIMAIKKPANKVSALSAIAEATAEAAVEIAESEQSIEKSNPTNEIISYTTERSTIILEQANNKAREINDSYYTDQALSIVIKAYAKTAVIKQSLVLLSLATQFARGISNPYFRDSALSVLVEAHAKMAAAEQSDSLLKQAIETGEGIDGNLDPAAKAQALSVIVQARAKIAVTKQSIDLLTQAIEIEAKISDTYSRISALASIARAAVKLKNLRLAYLMALKSQDEKDQARMLALVLKTWAEVNNPALVDKKGEEEDS